ncbi:MAG: pyruvate kinase [bacterium]
MHIGKKTKIVCTIGPVTESQPELEKLLRAGMNVMRINFSHGDFKEHQAKVDNLKKAIAKTNIPAATLQDLGGPKIRTGEFGTPNGRVTIEKGQTFILTTEDIIGDVKRVHINYAKLPKEVQVGHRIMLDDGKKELKVEKISGNEIITKVIAGGELKGRRGANFPDTDLSISSLTPKDKTDLVFGIKNDVDYVALSFVRRPSDIQELREILNKAKSKAGIVAKIETPQAVQNIDEIIELSDAIMVARGDLAVEIPAENVPLIQKMIIKKCNEVGKPVITATQMMESMIKSPVPTRAEVSDVANAILDGTDAIMLSEETTLGDFPIKAVEVMTRVSLRVENDLMAKQLLSSKCEALKKTVSVAITSAAVDIADIVGAKCIVSLTETGKSSKKISRHKGDKAILVVTPNKHTFQKSLLFYGCYPVLIKRFDRLSDALKVIRQYVLKNKIASKGEKVVVVSGVPFGKVVETNSVIVEVV